MINLTVANPGVRRERTFITMGDMPIVGVEMQPFPSIERPLCPSCGQTRLSRENADANMPCYTCQDRAINELAETTVDVSPPCERKQARPRDSREIRELRRQHIVALMARADGEFILAEIATKANVPVQTVQHISMSEIAGGRLVMVAPGKQMRLAEDTKKRGYFPARYRWVGGAA